MSKSFIYCPHFRFPSDTTGDVEGRQKTGTVVQVKKMIFIGTCLDFDNMRLNHDRYQTPEIIVIFNKYPYDHMTKNVRTWFNTTLFQLFPSIIGSNKIAAIDDDHA